MNTNGIRQHPLRVTIIFASKGPAIGGLEKQVAIQTAALAEKGAKITIIGSPHYQHLFSQSIEFRPESFKQSRHNPFLKTRLARFIQSTRPDIVHAHGHKATQCVVAIKQKIACPIVCTAHGTKQKNNSASQSYGRADLAIAVSQGVADSLPSDSLVIPNAIMAPQNKTNRTEIDKQFDLDSTLPLIVAAGRLDRVKRYDRLVRLSTKLAANFLLVGDGPLMAELRDLLKQQGNTNLKMTGYQEKAIDLIATADLLCITSEREGMSLVMLEALIASTPIVSTSVSGTEWLPSDFVIEEPKNAEDDTQIDEAILQKIKICLENLKQTRKQYAPYFQQARLELSPQKIADTLLTQYHALQNQKDLGKL